MSERDMLNLALLLVHGELKAIQRGWERTKVSLPVSVIEKMGKYAELIRYIEAKLDELNREEVQDGVCQGLWANGNGNLSR